MTVHEHIDLKSVDYKGLQRIQHDRKKKNTHTHIYTNTLSSLPAKILKAFSPISIVTT